MEKRKPVVKMVKSFKYLGAIIDKNLSWAEHIEIVKSKLLKAIGVLYKTRYFLNKLSLKPYKVWSVMLGQNQ